MAARTSYAEQKFKDVADFDSVLTEWGIGLEALWPDLEARREFLVGLLEGRGRPI